MISGDKENVHQFYLYSIRSLPKQAIQCIFIWYQFQMREAILDKTGNIDLYIMLEGSDSF